MTSPQTVLHRVPRLLIPALALTLLVGCGKRKPRPSIEAGIVPAADFICRINLEAIGKTPIGARLQERVDQPANPTQALLHNARLQFEATTGITHEDVTTILLSGAVDNFTAKNFDQGKGLDKLSFVVAIKLGRKTSFEKLSEGLNSLASNDPALQIEKIKMDKAPLLRITSSYEGDSGKYVALSDDGQFIFVAFNANSIQGALARTRTGAPAALSAKLRDAGAGLPRDALITFSFLAPESIREHIREEIKKVRKKAQENPFASLSLGYLTPFANIQTLNLACLFSETLEAEMSSDLGEEDNARNAAAFLNTLALPFIAANFPLSGAGSAVPVVEQSGAILTVRIVLNDSDLQKASAANPLGASAARAARADRGPTPSELEVHTPEEFRHLIGRPLASLRNSHGKARGEMETAEGTTHIYDGFQVFSRDGNTVTSVRRTSPPGSETGKTTSASQP